MASGSFPSLDDRLAEHFNPVIAPAEPPLGNQINGAPPRVFTDLEIQEIQTLLKVKSETWSQVPRTYIVLRIINELALLDKFIAHGFTDYNFPVSALHLPAFLRPHVRSKFTKAQSAVLTKTVDLEKGREGQHVHFDPSESAPYEVKKILGHGGFSNVQKVLSLISYKEYARKLIPRTAIYPPASITMKSAINELLVLKRVEHHHIVDFIGSYTDSKYFGLIMAPVAEHDLAAFLKLAHGSDDHQTLLRSFFGCLATALAYLHDSDIRHKDIKPENILVKQENVLFADFGLARDFRDASRSETTGKTALSPGYCAPEVAAFLPRDTSSDVWSLGCVFLEIVGVLKGRTVEDRERFFESRGSGGPYLSSNRAAYKQWVSQLRSTPDYLDDAPLDWVDEMVRTKSKLRATAREIVNKIVAPQLGGRSQARFCGLCCRDVGIAPLLDERGDTDFGQIEDPKGVNRISCPIDRLAKLPVPRKKRKSVDSYNRASKRPSPSQVQNKKNNLLSSWLWLAAKRRDTNRVLELVAQGARPHSSTDGITPLHWAASQGSIVAFNALIEAGAADAQTPDGMTVFMYAAASGSVEIARSLLARGVKPDVADNSGTTSLSLAAELGHEEIVRLLLEEHHCQVDKPDNDGGTPLSWASWNGHLNVVRLLLKHGAQADWQDIRWGRTPCSWAAEHGHWEVIKLLCEKNVDPDSISTDTSRTPLSYATEMGHLKAVMTLLETGAVDASRKDSTGMSPLDYAKLRKHKGKSVTSALQEYLMNKPTKSSE